MWSYKCDDPRTFQLLVLDYYSEAQTLLHLARHNQAIPNAILRITITSTRGISPPADFPPDARMDVKIKAFNDKEVSVVHPSNTFNAENWPPLDVGCFFHSGLFMMTKE